MYMRDSTAGDNPPTAGDILRACKKAIELIEQDPVRRKKLYEWRRMSPGVGGLSPAVESRMYTARAS